MKQFAYRHAIKQALTSDYVRYQHGCSVESSGRIISCGKNARKIKHPKMNAFSTHAEPAAIVRAGEAAKGCNLYVVRITAGKLANSKPCDQCQLIIRAAGIKKVFYSISENEWGVWAVQ